jgi:putative methionine-R-sulfoxide reductase with GAF domain
MRTLNDLLAALFATTELASALLSLPFFSFFSSIIAYTTVMYQRALARRFISAVSNKTTLIRRHQSSSATTTTTPAAAAASTVLQHPTPRQLRLVALHAAIPMVGFGVMDNWLMIQCGEVFDWSLGVCFGLSTLTAAGLGNTVSDVAGVFCGDAVEAAAAKLNLPTHGLSAQQLALKTTRLYHTIGGSVGIVVGCLLGMTCLLFMDTDRADKAKRAKELQSIFVSIMTEGHELVHADRATLWMYDSQNEILWSRVATGTEGILQTPADSGIVGACIQSGETISIAQAYRDERFNKSVDQSTGYHTKSVLVMPVRDRNGKIIGAIQMINKKDPDTGADATFTADDEKIVHLLATHVETFIRTVMNGSDDLSAALMLLGN